MERPRAGGRWRASSKSCWRRNISMVRWRRFVGRCRNLFRTGRVEAELAREVASHLDLLEDEFVRRGMSHANARSAARRACGGVEFSGVTAFAGPFDVDFSGNGPLVALRNERGNHSSKFTVGLPR